ncbi:MAG: response regulator [Prosthecobacter sp.]|jgi:signal transduction histidine kinase|uniref:ATP-binding protein n=1 Tax=Prosthecobacter sp. TaxID=1965333 RepID=UPI0019DEFB50|nr:ATP-binding protein [Prosthecobacter sp.]MBE2286316.1 response regulator [Prosthecobacter sp.]
MSEVLTAPEPNLDRLFVEHERPIHVRNYKVGSLLAVVFMPAGASLDYFVYKYDVMLQFLPLRLAGAVVDGLLLLWLHLAPGTRFYRAVGLGAMFVPVVCISWMIYLTEGAVSPYYAGLNLVMLASAIVMRWMFVDSIVFFVLTLVAYLTGCLLHGPVTDGGLFFNNLYFLAVTGVVMLAGTWQYNNLRRSEFDLHSRLDRQRAELEISNRKLRELDEAKSRFFANISHELRTPLTLLIAPLESLIHSAASVRNPEEQELLSTMHGNAMRLLKLINDLLDLVRLESGRSHVQMQKVDVREFINGIANAVGSVAKDKRIQLNARVDSALGTVMADPEKLERICLNLLFNALKFTAAGGRVSFGADAEDGWLVIEVRDTGMGIPATQLPHIFNRFWQADTSSQRKFQGMGIGLALVKELAEVQGGSVSAESEVGRGTSMTVKIPLRLPDGTENEESPPEKVLEEPGEAPSQNRDWIAELYRRAELFPAMTSLQATLRPVETSVGRSRKPILLIADDEPDMLRFLKGQLGTNFEVLEAVDGQQAVEKAAQFLPDIILSDMMMPEKDGLQVCRELRERTSTRSIPVVLLTARADEKTKIDCLAAGASDFLAKPFSLTEVQVRLKNLVDSRLYQKELASQKQQLEAALEQIKETESLLVQNEKLASLGRLSAGLIHEINNPLNYARQGLHIISRSGKLLPESERADFAETLKDVEDGVNRVVQIISDLRGFTRNTNEVGHAFHLKPTVDTALRFFAHIWKEGIKREVEVPGELEIRGDSNQFVQVLINLVQNALDAMGDKTFPEGESPCIRISGHARGDKVILTIKDNGPGIPKEIRDKIFDPFFTTKDVGKGMGLGLSICNNIINSHGGRVEVRSEPGQFTEFILEFLSADTQTNQADT